MQGTPRARAAGQHPPPLRWLQSSTRPESHQPQLPASCIGLLRLPLCMLWLHQHKSGSSPSYPRAATPQHSRPSQQRPRPTKYASRNRCWSPRQLSASTGCPTLLEWCLRLHLPELRAMRHRQPHLQPRRTPGHNPPPVAQPWLRAPVADQSRRNG